ncbi:Fic family protein [Lacihabitans sp. LS3-19]|uniref:Fic family protein n=1 Tax=Lacihabitans sp. LS3-19 TaxID=2487335 RepID=UPI0020CB70DA|nr:Fic family protein [Lacihabitans sp. LS3-19]MCP9768552.1 Fic family protein [Lacihabitans sp. LS3-19]
MQWIWENKNWPNFEYDSSKLVELENEFLQNSGKIIGIISHIQPNDIENLKIEILTQEAVSSSGIEGEILQRESVQSSIRKHLGLKTDYIKIPANAAGVSEMMVDVHLKFDQTLAHQTFFEWHKMLMNGRRDIEVIGNYRQHIEPMQIVSGNLNAPKVYYEAPPSAVVKSEMEQFINWYLENISNSEKYSFIEFVGIAHLVFEIIHPFEDGNGRLGRALVEKAISQKLKTPTLNSFSKVIELNKKEYYEALQSSNFSLNIDKWLLFFGKKILESQEYTIKLIEFIIAKTKFFIKFNSSLNERQLKVLLRVFEEGIVGFKGGLSAANYKTICGTSSATATRDLQELVSINALTKTGELKHTRYHINFENLESFFML